MCLRPHARRMASVIVCDLWANSPICFFKRIGRLVVSHRSLRFAQMSGASLSLFLNTNRMEYTAGVSSQLSLPPVGRWGFSESRVFDKAPRMASV